MLDLARDRSMGLSDCRDHACCEVSIRNEHGVQALRVPVTGDSRAVTFEGFAVIGSSEQVHVVDALAITGDEGRCSVR
jgi:hypothetical protein